MSIETRLTRLEARRPATFDRYWPVLTVEVDRTLPEVEQDGLFEAAIIAQERRLGRKRPEGRILGILAVKDYGIEVQTNEYQDAA